MGAHPKKLAWRIIADLLLVSAAFFLPWWFALFSGAALFFLFDRFFELFLIAFLMDLLYAIPLPRFGSFEFVLSLFSVAMYVLLTFLKRRMRLAP
jgi:hypothetical protein